MAVEMIDQANPPPMPSKLPSQALSLAKDLIKRPLDVKTAESLKAFKQTADYIAAAMIFLKDNALLERHLVPDDIRARLLGHWGTCPGLSLIYAHLNLLIRTHDLDMVYVVGPGHGAPAVLACLWIEKALERFYPQYTRDLAGLKNLITRFSTPGGFPSHINAQTPGSIHEGGELGYALSVAYGAVMDKPDLIVCVVVGDGEAETGPTATAWHGNKFIDPKESGAVIPILHVNGFKISERTISGCMDNREMACLFSGYGYHPRIVEDLDDIDADMNASLEWAVQEIHAIQAAARSGSPITKPRWPMLILRTPKGWGCPKEMHGEIIEGSFRSHQVPLPKAKTDPIELESLQKWLNSYRPNELFTDLGAPQESIERILPLQMDKRLGMALAKWNKSVPLDLPDWKVHSVQKGTQASCTRTSSYFLDDAFCRNKESLRIFSPDELVSNKLDTVFEHSNRNFQWDQYSMNKGGQVIEMLSEHTLQGFLQGYTMTGRTGIFPSYEAFLPIIDTMMVQYSKFMKVARETGWRQDLNSLNYIETSTWTRQEHNGYSHQNPCFIGSVLNLKASIARVYLPPDPNTFLSTLAHCLRSKNYVNLIVGSKADQPVWLDPNEAESHCKAGASIWKFASTNDGIDPDVVLVGIGAEMMFEVIAAAAYLRQLLPELAVRVVNVTDLMILRLEGCHPHSLSHADFNALFTSHRHIHFNYHGYANELQGLLFGRPDLERMTINSYDEEGTTTTPFDMLIRNRCSRYHVAEVAVRAGADRNPHLCVDLQNMVAHVQHDLAKVSQYIQQHAEDPPGTYDTPVFKPTHPPEQSKEATKGVTNGAANRTVPQHVCDERCRCPELRGVSTPLPGGFRTNGNL